MPQIRSYALDTFRERLLAPGPIIRQSHPTVSRDGIWVAGPGVLIAYERSEPPRDVAILAADTGDECVIERLGDDRNSSWVADVFRSPE